MIFDQFITKWLGKKADWDNAYGGQCVDLFRFYINEVLGKSQPKGVTGAADFWTAFDSDPNLNKTFDKITNTPTGVPQKGDCVIWNKKAGGGFGHVAIFIEGTTNSFTSLDQNWPTLSKVTKTKHDYINVLGWFRPKSLPITEPINMEDKKLADEMRKVIQHNSEYTTAIKILAAMSAKDKAIGDKDKELTTLKVELEKTKNKATADLDIEKINSEKKLADAKSECDLRIQSTINDYKAQIKELEKQITSPAPAPKPPDLSTFAARLKFLIFG